MNNSDMGDKNVGNNKVKGVEGGPLHYDIIVVGAGLVGAAFALRMARILADSWGHQSEGKRGKIALLEARTIPGVVRPPATAFDPQVVALTEASRQWLDALDVWQACADRACPSLNDKTQSKAMHKQVITNLRAKNICAHVHYIPIHLQPFYQNLGFKAGDFPIAEEYYARAISLPLYPQLTAKKQQYIINTLLEEINKKEN